MELMRTLDGSWGIEKFPNFLSKHLENPKKSCIFVVRN